jgi:chromosome segregation ATPase
LALSPVSSSATTRPRRRPSTVAAAARAESEATAAQERTTRETRGRAEVQAAEDAPRTFPAQRKALEAEVRALERMTRRKRFDLVDARNRVRSLGGDLKPVLASRIAAAPEVTDLKKRLDAVDARVTEQEQKEQDLVRQREARKVAVQHQRGRMPLGSDRSVSAVDAYLKDVLNDPDSYKPDECGPVVADGPFWVVTCSFRAKNGFGALVLDRARFYLQSTGFDSEVVRMERLR